MNLRAEEWVLVALAVVFALLMGTAVAERRKVDALTVELAAVKLENTALKAQYSECLDAKHNLRTGRIE